MNEKPASMRTAPVPGFMHLTVGTPKAGPRLPKRDRLHQSAERSGPKTDTTCERRWRAADAPFPVWRGRVGRRRIAPCGSVRAFGDAAETDISRQRRQQHMAESGQGAEPPCLTRS